ncbi:hypothetical protein GO755_26635 [Spirosoma sp. HMF4905]|uniref:Endonuclease/exonuclease/phosphatase domain-containing protein n=1 Tax=Spirosoma arboris TaxID=2682092 RepID=A0A7K1SIT9_9BACT|nr:endonuclease/exonuclease/phosphatase family protein [Spirosoma arboris]MVM33644.1 hypothetical protein [Spirosoma arboris]
MPRLNFLFWNLQKKDLTTQLVNICRSREVDVLVLAENVINEASLLLALNVAGADYYPNNPVSQCKKVTIITKFHFDFISPVFDSNRITIRRVSLPLWEDFLLVGVHLIDKGSHSDDSQSDEATNIVNEINKAEIDNNIISSLVVGDFNMNPFESGMIKAPGFHATMSSAVANALTRVVQERTYKFFYNPMWSLYGDLHKEIAGSYYYRSAQHVNYDWNLFDQVLIRPSLLNHFVKRSLEIVITDGISSLLDVHGRPNKTTYSDHLPIFFSLNN